MRHEGQAANARDLRVAFNVPQSRAFRLLKPGHTVATPFGRGVGKSWFQRTVSHLLVAQWEGQMRPSVEVPGEGLSTPESPGIRVVFLMPTLAQFKKVHMPHLPGEVEGRWGFLGGNLNRSDFKIEYPGGSTFQVVSAEAAQGSRGIRCDVVIIDEADDVDPEVMDAITLAWFTEPHSLRMTLIGGTPKRGRYGLLWRAHAEWPAHPVLSATHHSVHATCYDAPKQVDRKYIDTEVKPKVTPAVFRREYLCDFDSAEGLVYSMFDLTFHVRQPPKDIVWSEMIFGVDHGFEDPAVFLGIGVQGGGQDATLWIVDEVYEQHRTVTDLKAKGKAMRERHKAHRQSWYADPSRPDTIEEYRRAGLPLREANNAIEDGVAAVADRLSIRTREVSPGVEQRFARLYIAPSCVNTIRELGVYRRKRDPRNTERVLDDIQDKDNHAMDSLRYAVFTRFGGPVVSRGVGSKPAGLI